MKNIKVLIVVFVVALSTSAYAQKSGVKTKNPQGALHVDGQKDNNLSGTPTAAQQTNDFIVTPAGNVGIGNTVPTAKLVVDNSIAGTAAIKIVDGTQSSGYVLTSDANGVGTWAAVPAFRPTVLGAFPSSSSTVNSDSGSGNYVNSGVFITLPMGKWAINAGMTFTNITTNTWELCYLSSSNSTTTLSQTGFTHLGPSGNNTSYAGVLLTATNAMGFISGSSVIDVTASGGVTIYLLFRRWGTNIFSYATNNPENYFYAVPVQ